MKKTVKHPTLPFEITFNPETHKYIDNERTRYISATEFVSCFFEPFDIQSAATRTAARTGQLELEIIQQWEAKRDASAAYGTRCHEYAEAILKGDRIPNPLNAQDQRAFAIIDYTISQLAQTYEFYEPEQIVFDPLYRIAGTIDLPARNKRTKTFAVLDWKFCENITNDHYNKRALKPIPHIFDSKLAHYQLQLSLYAWLLTSPDHSAYPTAGEPVELALIHIPLCGNNPVWRPAEYDERTILVMINRQWQQIVRFQKSIKQGEL